MPVENELDELLMLVGGDELRRLLKRGLQGAPGPRGERGIPGPQGAKGEPAVAGDAVATFYRDQFDQTQLVEIVPRAKQGPTIQIVPERDSTTGLITAALISARSS